MTQLPAPVDLGASWDPGLAEQYGVVNGSEHLGKGIDMTLGSAINIQRDPRCGRNFEMFSEDPYLTGQLGAAEIDGITLNGHELSYWNDTANGWVLPDGQFDVYVGDSSALANLPLQGSFTVARSVGARYATATTAAPLSTSTVSATFVNDGDYPMDNAQFTVKTPPGWVVRPASPLPHQIAAGQSVTASF